MKKTNIMVLTILFQTLIFAQDALEITKLQPKEISSHDHVCYKFDMKEFYSDDNFTVDLREFKHPENSWIFVSHASNRDISNSFYCMKEENATMESYECVGDCDAGRMWLHINTEDIEVYIKSIRIEGPSETEDPNDYDPSLYYIESKDKIFTKGINVICPKKVEY